MLRFSFDVCLGTFGAIFLVQCMKFLARDLVFGCCIGEDSLDHTKSGLNAPLYNLPLPTGRLYVPLLHQSIILLGKNVTFAHRSASVLQP